MNRYTLREIVVARPYLNALQVEDEAAEIVLAHQIGELPGTLEEALGMTGEEMALYQADRLGEVTEGWRSAAAE